LAVGHVNKSAVGEALNRDDMFKDLTFKTKIFLGSVGPLFFLGFLGFISHQSIGRLQRTEVLVKHSRRVIARMYEIEKQVVDMENAER